jgi:hypothetical protein
MGCISMPHNHLTLRTELFDILKNMGGEYVIAYA